MASLAVPGAFIFPVSVHEPPGRATTTTEKPRLKLQGIRRQGAAAPRLPSPNLGPGPAGGGASQPGLGVGHSPPRRPPSGLATSPRWHLNLGCWRLATSQQQHTEQRARDFGRSKPEPAGLRRADLTLSLTTILGNVTDDHRRKIERAPPGTTIPCGEALIIAVYTQG